MKLDNCSVKDRIERLRKKANALFFIENPIDIFYLTEMKVSRGILCVYPQGERLFVDNRYFDRYKESPVVSVELSTPLGIETFLEKTAVNSVIIDPHYTSIERYQELQKGLLRGKTILLEKTLQDLRMIKDATEIEKMRKSALLAKEAMEAGKKMLYEGIEERKAAWEIEKYCREKGGEGMAFSTTVAFGENTAFPHYTPSSRTLRKGDAVLIDLGVILEGYTSDMTRSFLFQGKSKEYEHLFSCVEEAFQKTLALCRPGTLADTMTQEVEKFFGEKGFEKEMKHAIGHSLGLEVHEYPRLPPLTREKIYLQEGMVIAVEPGLYVEGKFGVRWEDTLTIVQDGYENLTNPLR